MAWKAWGAVPLPSAGRPCKSKVTSCWLDESIGMSKSFHIFMKDCLTGRGGGEDQCLNSTSGDMEETPVLTEEVIDEDHRH